MPTTRSADKGATTTAQNADDESAGSKHQIKDKTSPSSKRSRKEGGDKDQKTLEETAASLTEEDGNDDNRTEAGHEDVDAKDRPGKGEKPAARGDTVPSNILEKGLIYFFFRGRVGIDEPSGVDEIARSYFILRPLDKEAKLGEGTINDAGNSRLVAVPKKVFPLSGRDRWIAFVEKSNASFKALKDEFLASSDYTTKTAGVRHSPAATPAAEGIYAITTTGRESHLAYMITVPSELGEVQLELGLREKGSFIISTRNPQYEAPKGMALPSGPEYPKEVQDEFRALRWIPTQPKHLDYVNTQFLLIGETSGIAKATEPQKEDQENDKEEPREEMEKLEDEDTHRMEGLKGDDSASIFSDLHAHAKDYPKLQTTF
ncbi:hypothetical protein F5X96DRAFT_646268 [Biscogniauxia mediterranea]|nr:hypothetical protein F5X96DRAFT_646268 [Biscogniauxia mediterranea]